MKNNKYPQSGIRSFYVHAFTRTNTHMLGESVFWLNEEWKEKSTIFHVDPFDDCVEMMSTNTSELYTYIIWYIICM